MANPDNLTLQQLRLVRAHISDVRSSVRDLASRVGEMETREVADAAARLRHEERIAELEHLVERVNARLELRDDD